MNNKSKSLALMLSIVFILTILSACGNGSGRGGSGSSGANQGNLSSAQKGFGYLAETKPLELPKDYSGIGELCFDGERVYFLAYKNRQIPTGKTFEGGDDESGEEIVYYETQTRIFSMLPDGSDLREIEEYQPLKPEGASEEMVFSSTVHGLEITPDGNLVFIERSSGVLYKNGYTDSEYVELSSLRKISKDGKPLSSWDEKEFRQGGEQDAFYYIESFKLCPDGRLVVMLSGDKVNLLLFSPELKPEGMIDLEDDMWINDMGTDRKNEVFVFHMDNEGKRKLSRIDFENRNLVPYEDISLNFYRIMEDADDEYDMYVELGNRSVYGIDIEKDEQTLLFNWLEMGVTADANTFLSMGEGKYLSLNMEYDRASIFAKQMAGSGDAVPSFELAIVEKKPLSEIPVREELTMACLYLDNNEMSAVAKFNKTNQRARIKILDYSVYNTDTDYNLGVTKLMTELTAGNIPDMIVENYGFSLKNLAKKGVFLDLMPLIEADKDLGPDSLFEPVLKLMKDGDKLYTLYSGFELSTAIAPAGVFEDGKMGYEELKAALNKLKPGASYLGVGQTAPGYISMAMAGMDKFVDWKEGKAKFDGEDFKNVLLFAKEFPMEIDWSNYDYGAFEDPRESFINGNQLFYQTNIMTGLDDIRTLYKLSEGKIALTGLPGVGSNILRQNGGISISASCSNPELAWDYVRQRVLDDGYGALDENLWIVDKGRWSLPLNKAAFERFFESHMKVVKDEDGNERPHSTVSIGYETAVEVELFAMSEAERDFILSAFDNCILSSHYDEGLLNIINEELEPYIKGAKSLEETVKMIQNRASIYVSEKS